MRVLGRLWGPCARSTAVSIAALHAPMVLSSVGVRDSDGSYHFHSAHEITRSALLNLHKDFVYLSMLLHAV